LEPIKTKHLKLMFTTMVLSFKLQLTLSLYITAIRHWLDVKQS